MHIVIYLSDDNKLFLNDVSKQQFEDIKHKIYHNERLFSIRLSSFEYWINPSKIVYIEVIKNED